MKNFKKVAVLFFLTFLTFGLLRPINAKAADPLILTGNDGAIYISYDGVLWERFSPTVNGYICTSSADKKFTWRGTGIPYYNNSPVLIQYNYTNWTPSTPNLQNWCDNFAATYGYTYKSSSVVYTTYSSESWSKTTVYYY